MATVAQWSQCPSRVPKIIHKIVKRSDIVFSFEDALKIYGGAAHAKYAAIRKKQSNVHDQLRFLKKMKVRFGLLALRAPTVGSFMNRVMLESDLWGMHRRSVYDRVCKLHVNRERDCEVFTNPDDRCGKCNLCHNGRQGSLSFFRVMPLE